MAPRRVASPPPGDVIALAPNVLSVRHWDRLMGGALYAATPRIDWANLLRQILRPPNGVQFAPTM